MAQSTRMRIYDLTSFNHELDRMLSSIRDFIAASRSGAVSKPFQERIMLAVTHVNGCRYCSYFHTSVALREGMPQEEIKALLDGEFDDVPAEEAPAILFAEHYAESGGNYDPEAYNRLVETYGEGRTRGILGAIRAIMIGNIWGIMFDALQFRLRGRPLEGSRLRDEIGVVFGIALSIPALLIRRLLRRFTADRSTSLRRA